MRQPRAAGGGLSQTSDGGMIISATWGLGSSIAQGEVTPDRYELRRDASVLSITAGLKDHQVGCEHRAEPVTRVLPKDMAEKPCLSEAEAQ